MIRKKREPDEALGPVLDGHDQLARLERFLMQEEPLEPEEAVEPVEVQEAQILLLCGLCDPAFNVASLAYECGFEIELALDAPLPEESPWKQLANRTCDLDEDENIVAACQVGRNYYVCIFEEEESLSVRYVLDALESDAAYIGVWASRTSADRIFDALKADGAPDAELAAICCPMGLGIGADTPEQEAVAVVAELLAAKSGALKRLRYKD